MTLPLHAASDDSFDASEGEKPTRRQVRRPVMRSRRRDRRPLAVALTVAALFVMTMFASSTAISPVYARDVAPLAAQDGGLPVPPTDAAGNPLPPDGMTVPQTGLKPQIHTTLNGEAALPSSSSSGCSGGGSHTPDGDPYPVCPGPMPQQGGNCTWWSWEQWHDLGYNLPGWGDATNWARRAAAYGLQVGTVPRVNSIAVFPRGDGVWAFSDAGHVAFVTKVYSDLDTFDVTYQNYGDATLVHYGHRYRASVIQEPRYQDGELRFIYFPGSTGPTGNPSNNSITSGVSIYTADFAGDGHTQVLRYDRNQGTMDFLELSDDLSTLNDTPLLDPSTSDGTWRSSWEAYVGDFGGTGNADLLLYDRTQGKARFITLDSGLNIVTDVTQTGWKPSWEIYVGKFDGVHDQLLFYDRQTDQDHGQWTPKPGEPAVPVGVTGAGSQNQNPPGSTYDPNSNDWEHHHRTATLAVVDYNASDFTVHRQVDFSREHNTWEVRIGQFGPVGRDGIFFFDRKQGDLRVVLFDNQLRISATYERQQVPGGVEVYAGDFDGTLQDSLFLFDRSSGKAQVLAFTPALKLRRQVTFTNWGQSWEFYTGHFGGLSSAADSFLLYDRGAGMISFVGFGSDLLVKNQAKYTGFRSTWTVFIGKYGPSCNSGQGSANTTVTPSDTATPTNTPTPNPNNEGAPNSPTNGTTVTVSQNCPDSVLLVDERTYEARLINFSFDNGLQGGQPGFTETPVPWITPTPTNTPTDTPVPSQTTPTPGPTNGPAPTTGPSPTNTPTPKPTNTPTPGPTNTPTPGPTNTPTPTPTPGVPSTGTSTPRPTNTPAPTPTKTPGPTPTNTPIPTPTPAVLPTGTATPRPTNTSTPSPTKTPGPTTTSTPGPTATKTPTPTSTSSATSTPPPR